MICGPLVKRRGCATTALAQATEAAEDPCMSYRVAITGHRPGHLRDHGVDAVRAGTRMVEAAIAAAARRGTPRELRVGGAIGIDRAVADAARAARDAGADLHLTIAIPFPVEIMGARWSAEDRDRLRAELAAADEVLGPVSETYAVWAYAERNRVLLDAADVLLACWTGDPTGGTADAIRGAVLERGIAARNEQQGFARISPVEVAKNGRLTKLPATARFVFGANTAGRHGAGAARDAATHFGAEEGVGEGPTGRAYALPTVDYDGRGNFSATSRPVSAAAFEAALARLVDYARAHPDEDLVCTDVGAGLAGLPSEQISAAWRALETLPANLLLTPAQRRARRG